MLSHDPLGVRPKILARNQFRKNYKKYFPVHATPRGAHESYRKNRWPQRIPVKITKKITQKKNLEGNSIVNISGWMVRFFCFADAACFSSYQRYSFHGHANACRPPQKKYIKYRFGRKKAHKHKLFALVNVQMALGQTAGCPRVKPGQKVYVFASKHRKYKLFPLVNRRVVPGLSRLSKSWCVQSLCAFLLP